LRPLRSHKAFSLTCSSSRNHSSVSYWFISFWADESMQRASRKFH